MRPGWTPLLRPGALLGPDDRNERQVLVLCVPRKRSSPPPSPGQTLTRPLAKSRRDLDKFPARAGRPPKPRSPLPDRQPCRTWPLRGLSDGWWAHLTGPFTAAGWSSGDLTFAIDHEPGGRQHRQRLASVRHPAGWLRWRLSRWLGPDGAPLLSPSQQRAAAAAQQCAYLAERRHSDVAAPVDQADVPVSELLARLRARLGKPLGPRWRDPAEVAAKQVAESRAARSAAS